MELATALQFSYNSVAQEIVCDTTVPTTMGGAELSRGAGFTDKTLGRKVVVSDPGTIPRSILIDGKALATTPTSILVSTAMGQFRIAVETVYSRRHNPIGDALALHAITMLMHELPRCAVKDIDCLLHRALATNPKPINDAGPILSVLREAW